MYATLLQPMLCGTFYTIPSSVAGKHETKATQGKCASQNQQPMQPPEGILKQNIAQAIHNGPEVQLGDAGPQCIIKEVCQGGCNRRGVNTGVHELQLVVVSAHGQVVSVDEVDHMGNDGIAGSLWCFTHHAKVQVDQVA